MKRKLLQFILKKLNNANYSSFNECYECATKRGSPTLCNQCLWVRDNYKPTLTSPQQDNRLLRGMSEVVVEDGKPVIK